MHIRYLNGRRLKHAFIIGAQKLISNKNYLNRINVFPVADGDTGSNMAATMQSIVRNFKGISSQPLHTTARTAADSALTGARGNSGVILAQFLYGFSEGLKDNIRVSTKTFGTAVKNAARQAYKALSQPKEGTILTVLKDWADAVNKASLKTGDFKLLMDEALKEAKQSLMQTKNILPEMKKAGVVDAGALGIINILEGICYFITHGTIKEIGSYTAEDIPDQSYDHPAESEGKITYRFCTESMVTGENIDQLKLRKELESYGDSLIVAGSTEKTKVHIHTDYPRQVLSIMRKYGSMLSEKVDDMVLQYEISHSALKNCALLVDSTCDLPDHVRCRLGIERVPVTLRFNDKTWLDKDALLSAEFYRLMQKYPDSDLSTSQPAPGDFKRKFEFLLSNRENVIYLGLSEALSGTINSARSSASTLNFGDRITIINSRNLSIAYALLARRAGEAIAEGATAVEVADLLNELIPRTRLYAAVPTLDNLIKSGRVSKMKGIIANLFNLKPLITIDSEGNAEKTGIVFGKAAGKKKIVKIMQKEIPEKSPVDIAIAHINAPEKALWLKRKVEENFILARELFITEVSPALALHVGIGTIAAAFIIP